MHWNGEIWKLIKFKFINNNRYINAMDLTNGCKKFKFLCMLCCVCWDVSFWFNGSTFNKIKETTLRMKNNLKI